MSAWECEVTGSPAVVQLEPRRKLAQTNLEPTPATEATWQWPHLCDCGQRFQSGKKLGGHKRSLSDCPVHSKGVRNPLAQRNGSGLGSSNKEVQPS